MSDMSRPQPPPTAPAHELHDPMLVAQAAAGDVLDAADRARAEAWLSSCAACASLAADLRSVSAAVAWEPAPPRRRDFRLSAERADALRGNVVSRFLRRLALPQSTLLRPAAAGVMSIGLAFMLASTVWPVDELRLTTTAPGAAPQDPSLRAADTDPDGFSLSGQPDRPVPQADAPTRDVSANEPATDFADQFDGAEALELEAFGTEEPAAFEAAEPHSAAQAASELAVEAPGPAASPARKSTDPVVERNADEDARVVSGSSGLTIGDDVERRGGDELDTMALDAVSRDEAGTDTSAERAELRDDTAAAGATSAQTEAAPVGRVRDVDITVGASSGAGLASVTDEGIGIETVLLAIGLVLAVGGALTLVLAWLARRRTDPLVR